MLNSSQPTGLRGYADALALGFAWDFCQAFLERQQWAKINPTLLTIPLDIQLIQ